MFAVMRQLPAAVLAALVFTTSACASQGVYRNPNRAPGVDRRAYTLGYDEGRQRGEVDARRRRAFDPARHDVYRDIDSGFRGYGNRTGNPTAFRQGFVAGYSDAYRRYAQSGTRPLDGYASPAAQSGYRDGYEQGRDDARDGDRFDPVRAARYRAGNRDYDRRFGSLDEYKRAYRAAFQTGYERGYRESRR
jgi:hypothetical protein